MPMSVLIIKSKYLQVPGTTVRLSASPFHATGATEMLHHLVLSGNVKMAMSPAKTHQEHLTRCFVKSVALKHILTPLQMGHAGHVGKGMELGTNLVLVRQCALVSSYVVNLFLI